MEYVTILLYIEVENDVEVLYKKVSLQEQTVEVYYSLESHLDTQI